ncbi:MAG: hypothetical protein JST92_07700 [Deltaproteobacteria bacterium]|nr:hypothetical protein [Deltaproteobacteria bacterium]
MSLLALDRSFAAALPRGLPAGSAFDWWYLDARDDHGGGLVVIWASRLPLLQSGEPAINLCVYQDHREAFWLLQQHNRSEWREARRPGGFELRLGESRFELRRDGDRCSLQLTLDADVPGAERVCAELSATGLTPLRDGEPERHEHRWVPILPVARVEAQIACGSFQYALRGPGYADRNLGERGLRELGLGGWQWGRARQGERCRIWYALEGVGAGVGETHLVDCDGVALSERVVRGPSVEERGAALGLEVDPSPAAIVERGPFYQRALGSLRWDGAEVPALHERCDVTRLDTVLGPLVRMRVHQTARRNSLWLPLFSGPRAGRWSRLVRSLQRRVVP